MIRIEGFVVHNVKALQSILSTYGDKIGRELFLEQAIDQGPEAVVAYLRTWWYYNFLDTAWIYNAVTNTTRNRLSTDIEPITAQKTEELP